jgi:hypothetical protein
LVPQVPGRVSLRIGKAAIRLLIAADWVSPNR